MALVNGGRAVNERPLEYASKYVADIDIASADIDIASAYGFVNMFHHM